MARRVADAIQRGKADPETMTWAVAMLRMPTSVLPVLGPDLAGLLRLRAVALSNAGQYDEALIDVEEALRICRRARIVRRTANEVQLAWALSMRAHVLGCSGRAREAVDDARQALALCRAGMSRAPHRFGPVLLIALDELARTLDAIGERGQALPLGEELVRILRRLAPLRPGYEPFVAAAVQQLDVYRSAFHELTDASRVTDEALRAEYEAEDRERQSWWEQNWGRRVELGSVGDALAQVLTCDLGHWSRTDVERVMTALGRPAAEGDSETIVVHNSGSRLSAVKTDGNEARFGFGAFRRLELTFSFERADRDATFVTALDRCVRILGVPDLVGGPDAQAIWRLGDTITTLGRGVQPAAVWLHIEPMAARDAADLDAFERGDLEPYCSWLVWPDESRRHDVGVIAEKESPALSLTQFDTNIDRLFESLNGDLPLLHPHATYVLWQLTSVEGRIAQGWFCANVQHGVEIYEDGDVRVQMYPHGPSVGRDIAAATKAAVRAHGITEPSRELRFHTWLTPKSAGLQVVRLGLERDEHGVAASSG